MVTVTLKLATRGQPSYIIDVYPGDGLRITVMTLRRHCFLSVIKRVSVDKSVYLKAGRQRA